MKISKLRLAISEAERFLARAKVFDTRVLEGAGKTETYPGKKTAAIRRASLDLSQALSNLRKAD